MDVSTNEMQLQPSEKTLETPTQVDFSANEVHVQPIAEILATPTPIDNSGNEAQLPPRAETDATPTQVDHSANELQLSQSPMSRRPDWLPVGWELTKHTSCRNKNGNLRGAFLHTASGKVVLNKDRVLKLDRALP